MKFKLQTNILLSMFLLAMCSLPSIGSDETSIETYDSILAKLERTKDQNEEASIEENQGKEDTKEEIEITADNYVLTFDHDKLPNLNGIWVLKRKTIKRRINPVLSKPITFRHCNTILPFEKRDFEDTIWPQALRDDLPTLLEQG